MPKKLSEKCDDDVKGETQVRNKEEKKQEEEKDLK